jgi:hypothetical protein
MATGHRRGGKNPLAYMGVDPIAPTPLYIQKRAPLTTDLAGYTLGSMWVRTDPQEIYMLVSKYPGAAWVQLYPGAGGGASNFETDFGTANEVGGVLKILGDPNIITSGAGNQVDIELNDTVTISGSFISTGGGVNVTDIIQTNGPLAVGTNAIIGGDTISTGYFVAVAGYRYALAGTRRGIQSTNAVGGGGGDDIVGLGFGNAGQVLVGVDGTENGPVWRTFSSAGGTVAITYPGGPDRINLESNALPSGGADGQILVGATTGTADWTDLTTDGTIVVTGGANTLDVRLLRGTKGKVLMGYGAGVKPEYGILTSSDSSILIDDTSVAGEINLTTVGGGGSSIAFSAYFGVDTAMNTGEYFGAVGAALVETFDKGNCFYPGDGAGAPATFTAPSNGVYAFGGYLVNNNTDVFVIETPSETITSYKIASSYPLSGGSVYQRNQDIYIIELLAGDVIKWKLNSATSTTIFSTLRGDKCSNIFGFQVNKVTTGIGGNAYSFKAQIPKNPGVPSVKYATYVYGSPGYLGDQTAPLDVIYDTGNCFYPGDGAGTGCSYTAPVDGIYSFTGAIVQYSSLRISMESSGSPYDRRIFNMNTLANSKYYTYTMQLSAGDVLKWYVENTLSTGPASYIVYMPAAILPPAYSYINDGLSMISGYLIEAI